MGSYYPNNTIGDTGDKRSWWPYHTTGTTAVCPFIHKWMKCNRAPVRLRPDLRRSQYLPFDIILPRSPPIIYSGDPWSWRSHGTAPPSSSPYNWPSLQMRVNVWCRFRPCLPWANTDYWRMNLGISWTNRFTWSRLPRNSGIERNFFAGGGRLPQIKRNDQPGDGNTTSPYWTLRAEVQQGLLWKCPNCCQPSGSNKQKHTGVTTLL